MNLPRRTFPAALGVAVLATTVLIAPPALAASEDPPGWTLQENVDLSDASRWTLETGQSSNTSSYDIPSNVSFDDSGLTVRGKKETKSSASYTSGDAKGLGIEIPNYSRVEAVGSVPFGPGLWPALMWLRPLDSAHGEIDLMEVFGDDARVAATLHNEYGSRHASTQGSVRWSQLVNASPTGTHTYVMEKTPNRIVISVDGHVMLDAGPADMRPGFDWNEIFERPGATWYPRVTLQIGCAPAEPDCGIGLPASSWPGAAITLESLRIWKMAEPGETAPVEEEPVIETPVDEAPVVEAPVEESPVVETPVEESPVVETPVEESPVVETPVEKPVPETPTETPPVTAEDGNFALQQGHELRYASTLESGLAEKTGVTFQVPENIDSGVLYGSLQILSSDNGQTGYRTTAIMKPNGSLALTTELMENGRRTLLGHQTVATRDSFTAGDAIRLEIAYEAGVLRAKAWSVSGLEPAGWQLAAAASSTVVDDDGVQLFGYLSRSASTQVSTDWSDLQVTAR